MIQLRGLEAGDALEGRSVVAGESSKWSSPKRPGRELCHKTVIFPGFWMSDLAVLRIFCHQPDFDH
jgi:hypothetical protein